MSNYKINQEVYQVCISCKRNLLLSEENYRFRKDTNKYRTNCKSCMKRASALRYQENKEDRKRKAKEARVLKRKKTLKKRKQQEEKMISSGKWKNIKQNDGYLISNEGQVFSKFTREEKILTNRDDGYQVVVLSKNNKSESYYIHRLVATAFIPNPENLPEVNHKDGNKSNNIVDNLEWVTTSDNILHSYEALKRVRPKDYSPKRQKIAMLDDKGNILKTYPSMREAERQLNLSNGVISKGLQNDWKTNGHWWKKIK